jgi:SAM-dependent methyltransferase
MVRRNEIMPASLMALPHMVEHHSNLRGVLGYWIDSGFLPGESIEGAHVLDFGAGGGSLGLLLLELGAASVTAVDPSLCEDFYREHYASIPQMKYFKGVVQNLTTASPDIRKTDFDLIISSSVTEHVLNLPEALRTIYALMKVDAVFFTAHDNYYHPSGHHDNFILRPDNNYIYKFAGPEYWDDASKCIVSGDFRGDLAKATPWAWDASSNASLSPDDCSCCPFYKRSKPWAHLLNVDTFASVFPQPFFREGLNKLTPSMLRHFIAEAGLHLELFHRHYAMNEIPEELLTEPPLYNPHDLKTLNIVARARKR